MLNAVDPIGIATSDLVTKDQDRTQFDRWRKAYLPWIKSTTHAGTFVERYCESLSQLGVEHARAVKDYVETLTRMRQDGKDKGFGSFSNAFRERTQKAREEYFNGLDGAPAPETIVWDIHTENEGRIKAHIDGLRRTIVSVLTDLQTLSAKADLTTKVAQALDAPWTEMEKTLETLELPRPELWFVEETNVLKVRPELLDKPSTTRARWRKSQRQTM